MGEPLGDGYLRYQRGPTEDEKVFYIPIAAVLLSWAVAIPVLLAGGWLIIWSSGDSSAMWIGVTTLCVGWLLLSWHQWVLRIYRRRKK